MSRLDSIIHAETRLKIMAALVAIPVGDEIGFVKLRDVLDVSVGNLSTHLRKLEDADYVTQRKTFTGRVPATFISATSRGRHAFDAYVESLRAII